MNHSVNDYTVIILTHTHTHTHTHTYPIGSVSLEKAD